MTALLSPSKFSGTVVYTPVFTPGVLPFAPAGPRLVALMTFCINLLTFSHQTFIKNTPE
jgi:hypothetical protein